MSVDEQILYSLRQSDGAPVSGAELAQRLGVSRAAIWSRIEDLRKLGYGIEAKPHQGYRLVSTPDAIYADDLMARLAADRIVGRDIRVFKSTNSTNDIVEKLAVDGAQQGVVVFAETQSKGRGRMGRKWISAPGLGLYFSLLLKPDIAPAQTTQYTLATATAVRRAVARSTGLEANIKWPNDLLAHGLKLAGILTELRADPDRVQYLLIGIGINVNHAMEDMDPEVSNIATSIRIQTGQKVHRSDLAVSLLKELDDEYRKLREGSFQQVAEEWERYCSTVGSNVTIRMGTRQVCGYAEALDEQGCLLVRNESGRLERIVGGDVTLEKTIYPNF